MNSTYRSQHPVKKAISSVLAGLFCLLAVFPLLGTPVRAAEGLPLMERCSSACVYNFENDRMLYEYRAHDRAFPASTVKLMVALVAWDAFGERLGTEITVTGEMLALSTGNSIDFYEGEIVTAEQLFNCMLVNSANDAAVILAVAAAGSVEAFVERMNARAEEMGLEGTFYTNCTGMHDPKMITTASDTAEVAKACCKIPGLVDITSQQKYDMAPTNLSPAREIFNRNAMISKYYNAAYSYDGALGINAGATAQGGYTLAAVARDNENDLTYLAVVLGAEESDGAIYSYVNGHRLLDWAFGAWAYRPVLKDTQVICEMPVRLSSAMDYVTLVPESSMMVFLPTDADLSREVSYSWHTYEDSVNAPVEAGDEAGVITVSYGGELIGTCKLVTTASIPRSEFLFFLDRIEDFTKSRFFKGTIGAAAILALAYVLITAFLREKRIRKMSGRR
ncbi:MAG: D-alanyl-D-alanine carboxypeptidase [Ruminococcaceae bacterium]|nr:D-alanyl-D-alanine carboxypeptidase [Oscillospiraceae bacterium]